MVFGGIPYYWDLIDNDLSLAQNIDKLFFKENGQLHDEHQLLFKSLFSSTGHHREVIEALYRKRIGMQRKEIASVTKINDGKTLTSTLEELCECGFIRSYENYETKKYNKFYQIIDPFLLFVHGFLLNNKFDSWTFFIDTPSFYNWKGQAFEIVCLNHISAIENALGISGVATKEFSWKSKKK